MGMCTSAQRKNDKKKNRPSLVHSEIDKHSEMVTSDSVKEKPEIVVVGVVDQPISSTPRPPSNGYTSRVSTFKSVSSFSTCGSKEEAFFDTQGWLESDCEDFYSVNGDFTPSRGSTPQYRSIPGTPVNRSLSSSQVNRAFLESRSPPFYAAAAESNKSSRGTTPLHMSASGAAPVPDPIAVGTTESPPPEQIKKKKSKKLGELFRESIRERQSEEFESANTDSYVLVAESENKEKRLKHAQGCLPRLRSARFLKSTTMASQTAVEA